MFVARKKDCLDSFVSILQTEKSHSMKDKNIVVMKVTKDANKTVVGKMSKELFGFDPVSINICNMPSKKKFFRGKQGKRSGYKKAYVVFDEKSISSLMKTLDKK